MTKLHRSEEEKARLVRNFLISGQQENKYCDENNIPQSSFYAWKIKYLKKGFVDKKANGSGGFVKLPDYPNGDKLFDVEFKGLKIKASIEDIKILAKELSI